MSWSSAHETGVGKGGVRDERRLRGDRTMKEEDKPRMARVLRLDELMSTFRKMKEKVEICVVASEEE